MGAAIFVSLEREIPGLEASSVDGKALSREVESLDALASTLKVKPIMELYSINPEELTDFLGDMSPEEGLEVPDNVKEVWFAATEGLTTVRALIKNLKSAELKAPDRVETDLKNIEAVLLAAEKANVKFHFSIDI